MLRVCLKDNCCTVLFNEHIGTFEGCKIHHFMLHDEFVLLVIAKKLILLDWKVGNKEVLSMVRLYFVLFFLNRIT